jgi:hypothetical protein
LLTFISLVLHPRYKISYLEDNDWEADDIKTAKAEVQEVFNIYNDAYDAAVIELDDDAPDGIPMVVPASNLRSGSHC